MNAEDTGHPPGSVLSSGDGGRSEACRTVGFTDAISEGVIYGWVWDPLRPRRRLTVEILCDGEKIGEGIADQFRSDLVGIGIGDGFHAFEFELPDELADKPESSFDITTKDFGYGGGKLRHRRKPAAEEEWSDDGIDGREVAEFRLNMIETRLNEFETFTNNLIRAIRTLDERQKSTHRDAQSALHAPEAMETISKLETSLSGRLDQLASDIETGEIYIFRMDRKIREVSDELDQRVVDGLSANFRMVRRGMTAVLILVVLSAALSGAALFLQF